MTHMAICIIIKLIYIGNLSIRVLKKNSSLFYYIIIVIVFIDGFIVFNIFFRFIKKTTKE